jgi:hypothetical protein
MRWRRGFAPLATDPAAAGVDADSARKAERTVEKAYRRAIVELFQGDDYLNMFKRRETYRHMSNAATASPTRPMRSTTSSSNCAENR